MKYNHQEIIDLYLSGLSSRKIAKEVGCGKSVVSYVTRKCGVSRPQWMKIKKCPSFSPEFVSYLDGLLISDGSLSDPKGAFNNSRYSQTCEHKSWLEIICYKLESQKIHTSISPVKGGYGIITHRYDQLRREYDRWYPNGSKVVPKDIDAGNTYFLKNWVYGDGSYYHPSHTLFLHTEGFAEEDINFLLERLKSLGFLFRRDRVGKNKQGKEKYRLGLTKCSRDFFDYIGPPDVGCFAYKWPK